MKRFLTLFLTAFSLTFIVYPQENGKMPLSVRQTGYTIDASLDTKLKQVTGTVEAFWVNMSADIVTEVQLHMYMNAFSSKNSTYLREIPGTVSLMESDKGSIELLSLTDNTGTDLLHAADFISPDDNNPYDKTVLRVKLPEPAKPHDTVFFKAAFVTKLPGQIRRTGYNDDYYFVAQWFPKFGVYEAAGTRYAEKGGWNCHQFHANSEFYSDHSVYNVKLTVPRGYVVGSGGYLTDESKPATVETNKTLTYRAEDIVDFAWTAWPGYAVFNDKWHDVSITLLLPGDRTDQVARQFSAVKNALSYLTEKVGPYPWKYVTVADPPAKGAGAGGMEYTTLFTSSSSYFVPVFLRIPEMVTIHEFGHAYFMGILASNEFEEPWLDEGVNSFWEERIVDHFYGSNSGMIDLPFLKVSDASMARLAYVHSPGRQVVSNLEYSWNYPHETYGMMSYKKTSTWLYTLMGIVGEETIDKIFSEYYKKWAFRHPSGKDFIQVANDVVAEKNDPHVGNNLNWFFDQTLGGTGICDYRVANLYSEKSDSVTADTTINEKGYRSVIELERVGELMLPVEVLVHFADGTEKKEWWDGKDRYRDFVYTKQAKAEWVKIDPDFKNPMDVNIINNSLTTSTNRIPVKRISDKIIAFIEFFMTIFSV